TAPDKRDSQWTRLLIARPKSTAALIASSGSPRIFRALANLRHKSEPSDMTALPLIVFDVNETLLDLQTMEPVFERIFGEKTAMRLWFANFIMYAAALTVAGRYVSFTDIGSAVMKMLADTRGIKIDEADKKELTEKFSTMPPHREVPAALRR